MNTCVYVRINENSVRKFSIKLRIKMQVTNLLLFFCFWGGLLTAFAQVQLITQPPSDTTAALGTNATFSCRGNGDIIWEIDNTQVRIAHFVELFADEKVYVPLPTPSVSELIMTATEMNNVTRTIQCLVDPGIGVGEVVESDPVRLLVYAEPFPPTNPNVAVDGTNLLVSWTEPFSFEGEELSYFISTTNVNTGAGDEITVNTTRYLFSGPSGERNCEEYQFTIYSMNDFSRSNTAVTRREYIPTVPLLMRSSDVSIEVSLSSGVTATISFNPRDPCTFYPVTSYTFNITERATNTLITSIHHTSDIDLFVDNSHSLLPNQIYSLFIEAENVAGSTISEEILLYTTGLQSSTAVVELNGSITVTCTFATGATSTGCQVTILIMDSLQELFTTNITRQNGANQVSENMVVSGLTEESILLIKTAELLSGGQLGNVLFNGTVTVAAAPTTTAPPTTPATSTTSEVGVASNPTPFGTTLYFIIGAVSAVVLILLLFIILTVCIICSLKRKRTSALYLTSDEDLKNNYSYGGTPVRHVDPRFENGGIHARCNTYDYRDEQLMGPVYETINEKSHMGNGASARPVPNPVYGGEVVHSGSKLADNPVYAEASEAQGRSRGPTVMSQTSTTTDVSGLNPVYSGLAVPMSPLSLSSSYSASQPPTSHMMQSVVPQPSPGGAAAASTTVTTSTTTNQDFIMYNETKLCPSEYATPDQAAAERYAAIPVKLESSQYSEPQHSPTLSSGGAAANVGGGEGGEPLINYTNAHSHTVPTDPETGYSILSRSAFVEPPPGPIPVYETIKVKDTRPPVKPDSDGVTLQTNTSYGLLLSDTASGASISPTHSATATPTTPGSPTRTVQPSEPVAPLHSPPPKEPPPPSPQEAQTS